MDKAENEANEPRAKIIDDDSLGLTSKRLTQRSICMKKRRKERLR